MARIILVDDSVSARTVLGQRLTDEGHEVTLAEEGASAAEMILRIIPDVVVTDLWMPGISGLQLCRLLRADSRTTQIPVILLTASDDRRTRFWAKHSGATAYVTKDEVGRLVTMLRDVPVHPPASRQVPSREIQGNVLEHLSQLLDAALFESTIAARVRSFSQTTGDVDNFFGSIAELASEVIEYRWLALSIAEHPLTFVHAHYLHAPTVSHEVEAAFGLGTFAERRQAATARVAIVADDRTVHSETSLQPLVEPVRFHGKNIARVALSPSRRGVSSDDRRFLKLLAAELGGPLQMVLLVAETKRLANTDGLTGLLNRRAFIDGIEEARNRSARAVVPLSLFLLDIDHFKKINDSHGHDGGDSVLRGVAQALVQVARKSDLVARWGGEEFVVALPETSVAGARVMAERVRRAISERRYELPNGEPLGVTASIGIASSLEELWRLDEVVQAADRAMYSAKNRGRNRVEVA